MTFTFETLPIENKEFLRQRIITLYDLDIATVSCSFSSRNYVFIFGEGCFPAVIRVGIQTSYRMPEDVLSELMWLDDLKSSVANICQPLPSLENKLVEAIQAGDSVYLVTMFRKANGSMLPDTKWDDNYFYNSGALLGKIHRASSEQYQLGFRYKRKHWHESPAYDFSTFDDYFEPSAKLEAQALLKRIKSIPQDPKWYNMIHGDYHNSNLFCNWGELWAFDFDDCCYGHFMFDIVCLLHIFTNSRNYASAHHGTAHDLLLAPGGIRSLVKAGYCSEYSLPDEHWDLFDDFYRLRIAQIMRISIMGNMYSRDLIIALYSPYALFLKTDMPPIDRLEQVRAETLKRITPEQLAAISKIATG